MKSNVLSRYRVMAYITAVWLLVFTVAIIMKYGFDTGDTMLISQIHGVLFIVYVVFAFDLGSKAKWPFGKLLWVLAMRLHPRRVVLRGAEDHPGDPAADHRPRSGDRRGVTAALRTRHSAGVGRPISGACRPTPPRPHGVRAVCRSTFSWTS